MSDKHTTHSGAGEGNVRSYLTGLILSVVLTVIPFALVMTSVLSDTATLAIIMVLAVVQIIVQLVCFLHMNNSSEQFWNVTSLVFTVLIVGILVVGSLWIMFNLNHNVWVGH